MFHFEAYAFEIQKKKLRLGYAKRAEKPEMPHHVTTDAGFVPLIPNIAPTLSVVQKCQQAMTHIVVDT